jgi:hypothetical protein
MLGAHCFASVSFTWANAAIITRSPVWKSRAVAPLIPIVLEPRGASIAQLEMRAPFVMFQISTRSCVRRLAASSRSMSIDHEPS